MKFDSKSFNPEAWGKYMEAIPNEKLNKLRASRAIARDKRLQETFKNQSQTSTVYAKIPYFGLIGGEAQNYDGTEDLTPNRTTTYEQGVFTYGRMNAWVEADFSYDVTGGADFDKNIRQQITEYWNGVSQDVILSILKGVFSMSTGLNGANKKFVDNHTLNIGDADEATTEAHKVNATTLNTAIQKACGDNKGKFSLAIMHSTVATNLENLNLLAHLKYTDEAGIQRELDLATWNGRIVIIDDSMPAETKNVGSTGKTQTLYTTYILGDGAIGFEDVGVKIPWEMSRDAFTKGGETALISRERHAVSVAGVSYTKKSQATNSPTNAELENAQNWELINDGTTAISDKVIPIARIISRG